MGGSSSSIIKILDKMNNCVVKTIGSSVLGLTTNDVDYSLGVSDNLGATINSIITENSASTITDLIILLYPGEYTTSTQIALSPNSSTKRFYLIGVGNKEQIIINSNSSGFSNNNWKSFYSNFTLKNVYTNSSSVINIKLFNASYDCTLEDISIDITNWTNRPYILNPNIADITFTLKNVNYYSGGSSNSNVPVSLVDSTISTAAKYILYNCNFYDSCQMGFNWGFTGEDYVDIRNSVFTLHCSSSHGTVFSNWSTLILINNDIRDSAAYDEDGSTTHSYLATISTSHDKCIILNNIYRKMQKAGMILSSISEANLKDSDVYDFNIIATP